MFYWRLFTLRQHKYILFSPRRLSLHWQPARCASVSFLMEFRCVLFSKQWQFIHFALNAFRLLMNFFALACVDSFRNGWMGFISTPVFQFPFENLQRIFHQYPSRHRDVCEAIPNCINNKICMDWWIRAIGGNNWLLLVFWLWSNIYFVY